MNHNVRIVTTYEGFVGSCDVQISFLCPCGGKKVCERGKRWTERGRGAQRWREGERDSDAAGQRQRKE